MKKCLLYPSLWGVLTLSLLSSCRTEDGIVQRQQEKDMRFSVFVPKSGETINYADGFALLMKRYDGIHKTNISGINNKKLTSNASASIGKNASVTQSNEEYVEFNIRTETITKDNGDKMIVFPRVKENKLIGVVATILTDKETKVRYITYDDESLLYLMYKEAFQEALSRYQKRSMLPRLSASIKMAEEKEIPGVTITVPKPTPKQPDKEDPRPPVDMTEAKCPAHMMCLDRNSGGGSSTDTPLDLPPAYEIDIEKIKNNKCAYNVYKKLKSKSQLFNNLLGKFDGNAILDLKLDIRRTYITTVTGEQIETVANTEISNVNNGYVTIAFNPNYLGSSELGRASTFIHEMFHAYMAWQLKNAGWDGLDNANSYKSIDEKNLPGLLKAYKERNYNAAASEHEFIANYYIPKIVNALKAYDPKLGTDSEYEAIAWNGLQGTESFNNMRKQNNDRWYTISSIISDNIKNKSCGN
ncbi:hypothetical protein [Elizabethkingia meningoseptica]|uniref:hypothetical protein n=1 Tax=Elizabethkingia meningoseptica TaxID=238 RepID=UPI003016D887